MTQDNLIARLRDDIAGWEQAYPLSAFPEPDLKRAAEILKANGMTLDAISASNMRHVVSKLAPLIHEALDEVERLSPPLDGEGVIQAAPIHDAATIERFWAKVDRRGPDECWPWLGAKGSTGRGGARYGRATVSGVTRPAQQVAWEIANGEAFPSGKIGCHSCDNPICVNPAHIWPGTQSENIKDCADKGRHPSKPHDYCSKGHALTPDNRRPPEDGSRCIQCSRIRGRRNTRLYRQRLKESQND